jgi:hypothetical protein
MPLTFTIDLPADLVEFQLPAAVSARLQSLFHRQDAGDRLSPRSGPKPKAWPTWPSYSPFCD